MNRTSVGQPSAAFRSPSGQPSADLWVGVDSVGTGSLPQTPPTFLYVYNVHCCWCCQIVLTRRIGSRGCCAMSFIYSSPMVTQSMLGSRVTFTTPLLDAYTCIRIDRYIHISRICLISIYPPRIDFVDFIQKLKTPQFLF